jgi:hypothetical protein
LSCVQLRTRLKLIIEVTCSDYIPGARITARLISTEGKVVKTFEEFSRTFKVDMADLPSGLYVLQLKVNGTILHKKNSEAMKQIMLSIGVLFLIQSVSGQTESIGNWVVDINTGIEAHDKRLFNYARPEREALLRKQPEFWGTYHFGLNMRRKVWQNDRFVSYIGLGVGYERATFIRSFDHFYFENPSFFILLTQNRYKKVLTPLSLLVFYELVDHWFISGELASNFLIFRSVDHTENDSDFFPYSEGALELDDIQLRLGVNYRSGKFLIGLRSRVVNFQKIDRIIFNRIVKDPRTDQTWERYNPLRFDLTMGYTW